MQFLACKTRFHVRSRVPRSWVPTACTTSNLISFCTSNKILYHCCSPCASLTMDMPPMSSETPAPLTADLAIAFLMGECSPSTRNRVIDEIGPNLSEESFQQRLAGGYYDDPALKNRSPSPSLPTSGSGLSSDPTSTLSKEQQQQFSGGCSRPESCDVDLICDHGGAVGDYASDEQSSLCEIEPTVALGKALAGRSLLSPGVRSLVRTYGNEVARAAVTPAATAANDGAQSSAAEGGAPLNTRKSALHARRQADRTFIPRGAIAQAYTASIQAKKLAMRDKKAKHLQDKKNLQSQEVDSAHKYARKTVAAKPVILPNVGGRRAKQMQQQGAEKATGRPA
jgi:hypothetical protein